MVMALMLARRRGSSKIGTSIEQPKMRQMLGWIVTWITTSIMPVPLMWRMVFITSLMVLKSKTNFRASGNMRLKCIMIMCCVITLLPGCGCENDKRYTGLVNDIDHSSIVENDVSRIQSWSRNED